MLFHQSQRSLIKSVQAGTIVISGAASATATITAVVPANAIVLYLGASHTSGAETGGHRTMVRVALTNATTVTGTVGAASSNTVLSYVVVEFWPGVIKSIQAGTISLATTTVSATATITAVTTAKSALFPVGWSNNLDPFLAESICRVALTNATTVTATKVGITGTDVAGYQVVEFF